MILGKDRMIIGKRYLEILQINQEEYSSYKFWEDKQREEIRQQRENQQSHQSNNHSHSHNSKRSKHHRSSSSSPSYSRSRSRERTHPLLSEAAIKIRGLPFALNNWDIEEIFKRYNFVRGSVKLGFMGERKTGEAVILFPNNESA